MYNETCYEIHQSAASINGTEIMPEIERGYFQPSESMIDLTEVFIERIVTKFKDDGVDVQVQRQPNGITLFLGVNEVYSLYNNGVVAELKFKGYTQ
jgi:hypothetical protein